MSDYVPQVGGNHYQVGGSGNQHWDLVEEYDIDYLVGNASKYVVRFDRKGQPKEDLEKGLSYLRRMHGRAARRTIPQHRLEDFYFHNQLSLSKQQICDLILGTGRPQDIAEACRLITILIEKLN